MYKGRSDIFLTKRRGYIKNLVIFTHAVSLKSLITRIG
ncbi:hypothetical protein QF028_004875 [Neobacillus sp. B4I6]